MWGEVGKEVCHCRVELNERNEHSGFVIFVRPEKKELPTCLYPFVLSISLFFFSFTSLSFPSPLFPFLISSLHSFRSLVSLSSFLCHFILILPYLSQNSATAESAPFVCLVCGMIVPPRRSPFPSFPYTSGNASLAIASVPLTH